LLLKSVIISVTFFWGGGWGGGGEASAFGDVLLIRQAVKVPHNICLNVFVR
jgi:hypothetical protein